MIVESVILAAVVPAATLAGAGVSLWVRDKARAAADERLREMLKGALAEFKLDFIETLNGTYTRTLICDERHGRK
jgi:hypothetical protein